MQQPGYGYMQPGAYPGPPLPYNVSQPPYASYPPPPASGGYSSGWDQTSNPPGQQTTVGTGYDYYNQQQPQKSIYATGRSCTSCMVHHEGPELITQRSERRLAIEKLLLQETFSRLAQSWLIWVTPCQEEGEEDGKQTDRLIQVSIIVNDGMNLCLVAWILWPDEESRYSPNLEKVVKKRLTSEVRSSSS
ncbi:hypothetical protein Taro_031807 [Colocasia esculenta]|uniref:Uncharacterized protein n=1 Tax=Colocasia esculenta TaxID=4460 RepID=A0A843VVL2_COLES|nr:hypothetical protein [Colocasia esculenta]